MAKVNRIGELVYRIEPTVGNGVGGGKWDPGDGEMCWNILCL